MKIVRAENVSQAPKNRKQLLNELTAASQEYGLYDRAIIDSMMDELLQESEKTITFTVTLTKKQHEKYVKKGGEKWLKEMINRCQI